MSSNKLIDYNSPEKAILNEVFIGIPFMDKWISSIIEEYIYSTVKEYYREGEHKGDLKREYRTRFGIKDGKYKEWWFDNGQLRVQTTFLNNEIHGDYKCWYNNGQLYEHTKFVNGKRHGEYKEWHKNGQIKKQCIYVDGNIEGEYKEWCYVMDHKINYNLLIEQTFIGNVLNGEYKEWYDNDQLRLQTSYLDGKMDGEYKLWNYNGELIKQHSITNTNIIVRWW
jgi:antitoxin component YwqK of YwqJK toxin-antitoxin module